LTARKRTLDLVAWTAGAYQFKIAAGKIVKADIPALPAPLERQGPVTIQAAARHAIAW